MAERQTHAWGFVGMALSVLSLLASLLVGHHHHQTPWWEILGFVLRGCFFVGALILFGWPRLVGLRSRSPFDLRSPIIRREPRQKISPPPVELGRVDFELYMKRASDAIATHLSRMNKEMTQSTAKITKAAASLQKVAGASVETRHRALARSAKVMREHARRMSRDEAGYRANVETFVTNSRNYLAPFSAHDLRDHVAPATETLCQSTEMGKNGTLGYLAAVRQTRSQDVSQAVNGASDELIGVLERVVDDTDQILRFCQEVAQRTIGADGGVQ